MPDSFKFLIPYGNLKMFVEKCRDMKTIGFVSAPELVTQAILKQEDNQESCQVSGRKEKKIANMSEIKDDIKNIIFLDETTQMWHCKQCPYCEKNNGHVKPMSRNTCLVFNSKVLFVL